MIGRYAIGTIPVGAYSTAETLRPTVPASHVPVASARAEIEGAAFYNLLQNPRARREYLVTLSPLQLA